MAGKRKPSLSLGRSKNQVHSSHFYRLGEMDMPLLFSQIRRRCPTALFPQQALRMEMSPMVSWAGTAKGTSGSSDSATDLPGDPRRFVPASVCGQINLPPTSMGVMNSSWGLAPLCVGPVTFWCWLRCAKAPRTLLQLRPEMNTCVFSVGGPRFDSCSQKAAEGQRVTFSASSEILWWKVLSEYKAALLSSARWRSRCTNLHPKNICM